MKDINRIKDVLLNREELINRSYAIGQKHQLKRGKASTRILKEKAYRKL